MSLKNGRPGLDQDEGNTDSQGGWDQDEMKSKWKWNLVNMKPKFLIGVNMSVNYCWSLCYPYNRFPTCSECGPFLTQSQLGGRTNRGTNSWTDRWKDGWIDGRMYRLHCYMIRLFKRQNYFFAKTCECKKNNTDIIFRPRQHLAKQTLNTQHV